MLKPSSCHRQHRLKTADPRGRVRGLSAGGRAASCVERPAACYCGAAPSKEHGDSAGRQCALTSSPRIKPPPPALPHPSLCLFRTQHTSTLLPQPPLSPSRVLLPPGSPPFWLRRNSCSGAGLRRGAGAAGARHSSVTAHWRQSARAASPADDSNVNRVKERAADDSPHRPHRQAGPHTV